MFAPLVLQNWQAELHWRLQHTPLVHTPCAQATLKHACPGPARCTPVPVMSSRTERPAASLTVIAPERRPAALGRNRIDIWQVASPARLALVQVLFEISNSDKFVLFVESAPLERSPLFVIVQVN